MYTLKTIVLKALMQQTDIIISHLAEDNVLFLKDAAQM